MNRVSWLSAFVVMVFASVVSVSGQDDKSITEVRGKVAAINKNAARYTRTKRDVFDLSTEGAEATYFRKGKDLKKITAKIYGETFNATVELYFENGGPIFYYLKLRRYDTQIGLAKPVKVVRTEEERYYFAGSEMIRVMVGKEVIKKTDERYGELRDDMLKLAEGLRNADKPADPSAADVPVK